MEKNIESHLVETRVFKPAATSPRKPGSRACSSISGCIANRFDIRRNSGRGSRRAELAEAVDESAGLEAAVREMVCRRQNQRLRKLPRSAPEGPASEQGRDHLGRRAGRQTHPHLPATASRGLPVRQCPEAKQDSQRRSRHHLSADDSGSGDRDAGLRAHRRDSLGRLRRIQRGQHSRPDRRLRRDGRHHGGRRLSARRDRSAEEQRR